MIANKSFLILQTEHWLMFRFDKEKGSALHQCVLTHNKPWSWNLLLDGGRKLEHPERTHAYMGRTCKLHTERPQSGIKPGTLATVLTTTPPCSPSCILLFLLNIPDVQHFVSAMLCECAS